MSITIRHVNVVLSTEAFLSMATSFCKVRCKRNDTKSIAKAVVLELSNF